MDGNFWHKLIATSYKSLLPAKDDESLPDLHPDWLTDADLRACNQDHTSTRLHPTPPLHVPFLPVPPSVAMGNPDQPSHPSQLQPCPNRRPTLVPEMEIAPRSPPPLIPEGANDEMEIVFVDDPEPEATDNGEAEHHDLCGPLNPEQYGCGKQ